MLPRRLMHITEAVKCSLTWAFCVEGCEQRARLFTLVAGGVRPH
jgi:hypothetical protein